MISATDFRYLQLAADAAGYHYDPTRRGAHGLWIVRPGAAAQEDQILWNSFQHPMQAHNMAVALKMSLDLQDEGISVTSPHLTTGFWLAGGIGATARCRAITLAAAQITLNRNSK